MATHPETHEHTVKHAVMMLQAAVTFTKSLEQITISTSLSFCYCHLRHGTIKEDHITLHKLSEVTMTYCNILGGWPPNNPLAWFTVTRRS
jgi:hypothetical protein